MSDFIMASFSVSGIVAIFVLASVVSGACPNRLLPRDKASCATEDHPWPSTCPPMSCSLQCILKSFNCSTPTCHGNWQGYVWEPICTVVLNATNAITTSSTNASTTTKAPNCYNTTISAPYSNDINTTMDSGNTSMDLGNATNLGNSTNLGNTTDFGNSLVPIIVVPILLVGFLCCIIEYLSYATSSAPSTVSFTVSSTAV